MRVVTSVISSGMRKVWFALLVIPVLTWFASCKGKHKTINEMALQAQHERIVEAFPKIPHDEILQQITGNRLYTELQEGYINSLISLKSLVDNDHTRLVVVVLSPEVGKGATLANTYGIPFIVKTCENLGLDYFDFSTKFAEKDLSDIMQIPEEGIWSKAGSVFVADLLDTVVTKYKDQESSIKHYEKKPATFGDLPPRQDEIIDNDNNMPYHVKVNSQGLRMDHDLTFPKTKQTILILGDSKIYSPFLDNNYIATSILQKRYPNKEIINAGVCNYTMEDYQTLYQEKGRFTEPDLVIVCTDGSDILNFYFSQRNRYSRTQKIYYPTRLAEDFYNQLYKSRE